MNTRLSNIYQQMKNRCYNPNNPSYKNYGGRGITICAEWNSREKIKGTRGNNTKGFTAFKKWALNNGYTNGLTIDRIDNSKGYSPDNCRWVNCKVQANNTRHNHYLTYKGKTQSLTNWCEELELNYNKVRSRLKNGWSVEKALEITENPRAKILEYKGKAQCLMDWCIELGLNYNKVKQRINKLDWSVEKAFETD